MAFGCLRFEDRFALGLRLKIRKFRPPTSNLKPPNAGSAASNLKPPTTEGSASNL